MKCDDLASFLWWIDWSSGHCTLWGIPEGVSSTWTLRVWIRSLFGVRSYHHCVPSFYGLYNLWDYCSEEEEDYKSTKGRYLLLLLHRSCSHAVWSLYICLPSASRVLACLFPLRQLPCPNSQDPSLHLQSCSSSYCLRTSLWRPSLGPRDCPSWCRGLSGGCQSWPPADLLEFIWVFAFPANCLGYLSTCMHDEWEWSEGGLDRLLFSMYWLVGRNYMINININHNK